MGSSSDRGATLGEGERVYVCDTGQTPIFDPTTPAARSRRCPSSSVSPASPSLQQEKGRSLFGSVRDTSIQTTFVFSRDTLAPDISVLIRCHAVKDAQKDAYKTPLKLIKFYYFIAILFYSLIYFKTVQDLTFFHQFKYYNFIRLLSYA